MKKSLDLKSVFRRTSIIYIRLLAISSFFLSCTLISSDQDLTFVKYTLKKTSIEGNPIKVSGYFYGVEERAKPIFYTYYRFFGDGTVNYQGFSLDLDGLDNTYLSGPLKSTYSESKFNIGIFCVKHDTIWIEKHERYYTGSIQNTYFHIGQILNDTTIRLFRYCLPNGNESVSFEDTLHFRSM